MEEDNEEEIEKEIEVLEFSLDDEEIDDLIEDLGELKESKKNFSFVIDDENELLIHHEEDNSIDENEIDYEEIEDDSVDEDDGEEDEDEDEDSFDDEEVVVAVSGYFDPIHRGHIEYFELAKQLGDKLVVILNNDKQCELKKGKAFMPVEDKKAIQESIAHVDEVFISVDDDSSVCKSLKVVKPHIFAKGGDRFSYEIPEAKICEELGIKIVDSLGDKVQSSSELIKNADKSKKEAEKK